jgi:hypothetical protein
MLSGFVVLVAGQDMICPSTKVKDKSAKPLSKVVKAAAVDLIVQVPTLVAVITPVAATTEHPVVPAAATE